MSGSRRGLYFRKRLGRHKWKAGHARVWFLMILGLLPLSRMGGH